MKEMSNNLFTFLGLLFLSGLLSLNQGFPCVFIAMVISCAQTQVNSSIQKLRKASFQISVSDRFLKLASHGGRVLHSSVRMNSSGRALVLTEANVQGQFLLISRI